MAKLLLKQMSDFKRIN